MHEQLLIEIDDLKVHFHTPEGILKAVDGVSFNIYKGSTMGLVGESGCGKSVTGQAMIRIVPSPGVTEGKILLHGMETTTSAIDLCSLEPNGGLIRSIRGKEISMIFQEPMTSFSPHYTMGNQIMEAVLLHQNRDRGEARHIAVEMLAKVGIANPEKRIDEYPHEFSGGMRQRAMIAMALSCRPQLLIADEPTTALDVTIQAQVLELMKQLQQEFGMGILFITHDMGIIAEMCENVAVMYLGKIVEMASADDIFYNPLHPYTQGLLNSIPNIGSNVKRKLESIRGTVPVPLGLPPQCGFHERCKSKIEGMCDCYNIPIVEISPGHWVRCFLYPEVQEMCATLQESTGRKDQ